MRGEGREDQDQDQGELEIILLPDGTVLLPRGTELMVDIADALGDPRAKEFAKQASETEVLVGRRMCG
jgi:hypothetical protein